MAQVVKINTYHVGLFAKFLETTAGPKMEPGSLLDQSLIFYAARVSAIQWSLRLISARQ